MQTQIDIESAVSRWCNSQFILLASFYTGRGVNLGDLNSGYLEKIYQGLKDDVDQEAATNFVRFVNDLEDLTASGFIQAFEEFWWSGCQTTRTAVRAGAGNQLSGRGNALIGEGFALIGAALGGSLSSPEQIQRASNSVKAEFIHRHQTELK